MNPRIDQLVKSLLQKDSLEQCSLQELQQFAEQNPYFGAAQLLLTKKLQAEKSEKYDDQLQKTYLFFHNPLWVEQLLNDTGAAAIVPAEKKVQTPVLPDQVIEAPPEAVPAITEVTTEAPPETVSVVTELMTETAPEPGTTEIIAAAEAATEMVEQTEANAPLEIPGLKIEAIDPAKAELIFEPFYTVDYFASQGIQFKGEDRPKDKFGLQLKSFTEWLKTMKRLPVTEMAKAVETAGDHKVDQLAAHSLMEKDIVTEAMAEVWEKQGNSIKAIDIYNKLSLLEPAKSTYFAAKIEDLKKLN
ncbi:MAG: hypothetical protein ABL876_15870 [Chitinophagaceae bacterium]